MIPMNRTRFAVALLPLALGCPEPGTDKIGTGDTSPPVCDRIHGATGILLIESAEGEIHFPTAAPDESTVTSSVAGPLADGTWLAVAGSAVIASADEGCNWDTTGGSLPASGEWELVVSGATAWAFDRLSGAMATSLDGGLSWSASSTGSPVFGSAGADPAVSGRLRAVTAQGVVGSDDGGASWSPLGSAPPGGVASGGDTYAAAPDTHVVITPTGLAITRTSGESWVEAAAELVADGVVIHRVAFSVDSPDILWVSGEQEGFSALFRSIDGGQTFSDVATSRSLDLEPDAPLWPIPGAPNEVLSAWGTSEDNYGINVYHVVAGDHIATTKVGAYYHVNDAAFASDGRWVFGVDGVK